MKKTITKYVFLCLIGIFMFYGVVLSQERAQDRRKWFDKNTTVSDDPRRIPVPPGQQGPEGSLVLTGGRIFDGTGAEARSGTVVIERNRIKDILPSGSTNWPRDAKVIDVAGKTIMPGLIDLHTHITEPISSGPYAIATTNESINTLRAVEHLRYFIESGITSIRDLAAHGIVPFQLKKWVSQNRLPGPRIFPAGQFITATGGHGTEGMDLVNPSVEALRTVDGPDEWRKAVREQFNKGADVIKLGSHFSRGEIAAAVEEAHALGLKVTVDAETFYIQWAVEAGVDVVEHPLPRTDETIRLMAEKGTESVPTLIPYMKMFDRLGGYYGSTSRRFSFSRESMIEMVRRMKRAGIKMGIGLDMGADGFITLPEPYIAELKYFVQAGHTISEALVAATKTSAEILDMNDKLGTITPGKLADVIVIDGKPDINLDDLAHIDLVIRDGYVVVKDSRVFIPRHISPGQEK